ncbi:MAG: DUF1624 domain-containing protein [Deltaproteobacteria bacterium]|nr:DUF1624 domain-containing protein [Deltaproteobacteria bacterium]
MSEGTSRSRVAFVDWLRLLAALQMIVGHTVDAVVEDGARASGWFATWTQLRGLTAPAFLVTSGISYALATRLDDEAAYVALRAREGARRRRVIRSVWLIVLGTLLHAFDAPWVIDVLQCVGASLLFLDVVVTWLPRPSHVVALATCLAFAVLVSARPIEGAFAASDHTGLARYALGWIDEDGGSLFPLIPWAFYVLVGLGVARITIPDGARTAPGTMVMRLAGASVVALVVSAACDAWSAPTAESWSSHPAVLLARTGAVLGAASVLAAIGSRWDLPAWGTTLAGETLTLYVVHLLVLFAAAVGPARVWPHALSLEASFALAAAMLALSAGVALGWARVWPPIERRWMPWLRGPLRSASATAKNEA